MSALDPNEILHTHLPMVLEAFCYGDKELFSQHTELENARVIVPFISNHRRYHQSEDWGQVRKYRIASS